jgi:cytochrome c553
MRALLPYAFAAAWWCGAALPAQAAPETHTVPDTIAQRVQACTACHGKEGVATNQGYFPRIAGKPAGYLYNQLQNFREGRRSNGTMSALVENMSDAYLMEIASYFAALDLPYPTSSSSTAPAQELARGRMLVEAGDAGRQLPACVQCHGRAMTGVAPSIPGLLGVPKDYLLAQFGAWRSGQRRAPSPDCMSAISQRLSPQDLGAVASYLSQQPVPADARPVASVALPLPITCGSGPR